MLSETKLDSSSPHAQFSIEGYSKPYRLDRGQTGGGLILFNYESTLEIQFRKQRILFSRN